MNLDNAVKLLIVLLSQASNINLLLGKLGELIQNARAQGRDITDAELDELVAADDAARQALVDAIAEARARNP